METVAQELIRAIAIVWHDLGDPDPLARSIAAETSRAYLGDILAWAVAEAERAREEEAAEPAAVALFAAMEAGHAAASATVEAGKLEMQLFSRPTEPAVTALATAATDACRAMCDAADQAADAIWRAHLARPATTAPPAGGEAQRILQEYLAGR